MPSLSNSPLTRSVPHSLFSRDMVAIKSWTSGLRCGRPPRERDFQRQNSRQPCPCERTTVSGVTTVRCSRQPAHHRRARAHQSSRAAEQPVPGIKTGTRSGPSGTSQHRELMAQEQGLEHDVCRLATSSPAAVQPHRSHWAANCWPPEQEHPGWGHDAAELGQCKDVAKPHTRPRRGCAQARTAVSSSHRNSSMPSASPIYGRARICRPTGAAADPCAQAVTLAPC
jgi:hypothetical protein